VAVDPADFTRRKTIHGEAQWTDLLEPIFRKGEQIHELPGIEAIRDRAKAQLQKLHPGIKRFLNPHEYPVGLELGLHELKTNLVMEARGI